MRYVTFTLVGLAVFVVYVMVSQHREIGGYRAALDKINNDMQINYAFQQATLMDLAECLGDK